MKYALIDLQALDAIFAIPEGESSAFVIALLLIHGPAAETVQPLLSSVKRSVTSTSDTHP